MFPSTRILFAVVIGLCATGALVADSIPSAQGEIASKIDTTTLKQPQYLRTAERADDQDLAASLDRCSTPSGNGICMDTKKCKFTGGTSYSGYCPGASNIQCCVDISPGPGPQPGPSGKAEYGVDVSSAMSTSTASCMANAGMTFVIPRGYRSSGSVDTNVCTTLKNAQSAGIAKRDVYMFPCPTCSKSASAQMSELVSYLSSNCKTAWSGRVWLDIEGTQYWYSSTSTNRSWYQALVDSCKKYSSSCGVYSSYNNWQGIFGSASYSYGSNLPLWYAHYDNSASFSDFNSFGGWTSPHVKQYAGDTTVCSMGVDKNYAAYGY